MYRTGLMFSMPLGPIRGAISAVTSGNYRSFFEPGTSNQLMRPCRVQPIVSSHVVGVAVAEAELLPRRGADRARERIDLPTARLTREVFFCWM
jgi:hypothetical protein